MHSALSPKLQAADQHPDRPIGKDRFSPNLCQDGSGFNAKRRVRGKRGYQTAPAVQMVTIPIPRQSALGQDCRIRNSCLRCAAVLCLVLCEQLGAGFALEEICPPFEQKSRAEAAQMMTKFESWVPQQFHQARDATFLPGVCTVFHASCYGHHHYECNDKFQETFGSSEEMAVDLIG